MKEEKLLTVRNYAAEKGVTTATVYQWILKEKVKFKKIDGVVFINVNK